MTEQVLSDEDKFKAGLIEAALVGSGLMFTIDNQISTGIKEGTLTIEQSIPIRHQLTSQAAGTMARGIEAVFNYLSANDFEVIKIKKEKVDGKDTSMATQRGAEPQGRPEREGQGVSQGSGLEPESSSEGGTERTRGDAA